MRYRFSLIDYTINPAGVTTVLTEDEVLGWEEMEIIAKRDSVWHGIFFESSYTKLIFVGEGYSVIKTAYDDSGSNANTDLFIEASCDDTSAFEALDTARLKYSRIKFIEEDSCRVEIPVEGTSCLQLFRSRYDQKVNLLSRRTFDLAPGDPDDLSDYGSKFPEIELPAKPLIMENKAVDGETMNETFIFSSSAAGTATFIRAVDLLTTNKNYLNTFFPDNGESWGGVGSQIQSFINSGAIPFQEIDLTETVECNEVTEVYISIEILYDLSVQFTAGTMDTGIPALLCSFGVESLEVYGTLNLIHAQADNTIITNEVLATTSTQCIEKGGIAAEWQIGYTGTWTKAVSTGDRLYLIFTINAAWDVDSVINLELDINWTPSGEQLLYIRGAADCDPSDSKIFLINECLSRTSEIITNDCLRVYSDYFGRTDALPYDSIADGCGSLESLTTGLYIRNVLKNDGNEPDFFISMKQLFDGLNAIHNIGIGMEDDSESGQDQLLRFEPVEYFYVDTILKTISDQEAVFEIQRVFDVKRAIAVFNFGYKKWETENNYGLDEINSKREYRTELTNVDTKVEKLSELIASSYSIELTRRAGSDLKQDFKYDNDTFIICLQRDGGNFEVEIFTDLVTTNLLSDTNLYNVRISPRRNFMRWYKSIRTTASSRFTFNAGDANYIAIVNKTNNDDCLLELQASDMGEDEGLSANHFKVAPSSNYTPIWLPEIWEFEYPLSYEEYKVIRANPTGRISVNHQGVETQCFIEEITYSPVDGIAKWKLLRAWQNV